MNEESYDIQKVEPKIVISRKKLKVVGLVILVFVVLGGAGWYVYSWNAGLNARIAAVEAGQAQTVQYINLGISDGVFPTVQQFVDRYNQLHATSTTK